MNNNRKREALLHRAIIERNPAMVFSLVKQLDPTLVLALIASYEEVRSHPGGENVTPLIAAIRVGVTELCRYLIDEGADVNWGNVNGMGPLCLALSHKLYQIAELLIDSGANVHMTDRSGFAPMYAAIDYDSPVSIVKKILSAGFPKDACIHNDGKVIVKPLIRAIGMKNVPVVKFLLEQNVEINYVTGGVTPLTIAITKNSPEIVKLLIDFGANIEGLNKNDPPPLYLATQLEETTILKILIDAGVNINRIFNPFTYSINTTPMPQATVLEVAVMVYNYTGTKMLMNHGADVNAQNPIMKSTPLHLLAWSNYLADKKPQRLIHRKIIQYVLENGADTDIKDIEGRTPIQSSFCSKNWIAIEEFVKSGVDPNFVVNTKDGSILRFAVCNKVEYLVQLCLAYGGNCFQKFRGEPLYNDVIRSNCPNILRMFWNYFYPLEAVPAGKFKNSTKILNLVKNQLLFFEAINSSDLEGVQKTLDQGAEVNCQPKHGLPSLHLSCNKGDKEIVKTLLEHGVNVSYLNDDGDSALHEAARAGREEICELLLRYGACVDCRGAGGLTPCQLAQAAGHTKVVRLLSSVSRHFSSLKQRDSNIVDRIKKELGLNMFFVYMNCVNRRGNTLLGEAIRLNLTDVVKSLMLLRIKADIIEN